MQHYISQPFQKFDASRFRVGIVVAAFNHDITGRLVESARAMCEEYGVAANNIDVEMVAGSVEIPVVLQYLAQSHKYNCLVALGAIIRGETPHFEYVAKIVSEGVLRVMLDEKIAIGFGVLTTENHEQALARVKVGGQAAEAALQTAKIIKR